MNKKLQINYTGIITVLSMVGSMLLSGTKTTVYAVPNADNRAAVAKDTSMKYYLALGDSYTIGQSVAAPDRFPVQVVKMLNTSGYKMAKAEIIATTGWTTADLYDALKTKTSLLSYDVVSLLIGVNNQYQGLSLAEYRTEFTALLQRSIELAGNNPDRVFVLSIPDYSVTPFAAASDRKKIAKEIDAFNAVNKQVASFYKVHYLYVTGESRKAAADPGLIANDGLHFSGKAYRVWAKLLAGLMEKTLK